jgi:hypothetical protein
MRFNIFVLVLLIVSSSTGSSVEIGDDSAGFIGWPFGCCFNYDLHHQVVLLSSEIGSSFEIEAISWKYSVRVPEVFCENFTIYLGYCNSDELGMSFDDNYIPGSKTLVYSSSQLSLTPDQDNWSRVLLDTPFWYNGTDNLIVEVQWDNSSTYNSHFCGRWESGANRTLWQQTTPSNNLSTTVMHMLLEGSESLDHATFGRIKVELGT